GQVGITDYWFRLSLPDFSSSKYAGDQKKWEEAGQTIREALQESKADFVEAKNVLGKEDTIATVQVDILVPERMNLSYIDSEGKEQRPIIIHRAILGS